MGQTLRTKAALVSGGRIRMIAGVKALFLSIGLLLSVGCAMPSDKALFETALAGAKAGAYVPPDAEWLGFEDASVMPLKNMTRVNVPYRFKGQDGERHQTYCTVWLKRVALTWVVDRCEPPKKPGTETNTTPNDAPRPEN